MVYDKSYYELLILIENKIQAIESKSQEVALPDNVRIQLESIKQEADKAYQAIEQLVKNSGLNEDSYTDVVNKFERMQEVSKQISALQQATNGNNQLAANDLVKLNAELLKLTGDIGDSLGMQNASTSDIIQKATDLYDDYKAQKDILEKQRRELIKIERQQNKVLEQTKEWKKNVEGIKKGYQQFTNNIKKSFNIIKDATEFWRKQDEQVTKMVATFGLTTEEFKKYRDASYKAGVELAYQYGKTQEDMVKLQQGYAEATGKNIVLTKDNYEAQFQLQQLMGEENSLAFTSGIEQFGVGINDARDRLYEIYKLNKTTGVSWSKTSKDLNNNLKLAQKYNFKGGLDNMMKMTVWANKMKINMQTIGSLADKISNPEGAIETAAKLQVLGGAFATMANPLQMLYESLDDVGGLAQRVEKMFDGIGRFDRDLGEVRIAGPDRLRIKAAAEAMGMSYEEAMNVVNNKARRTAVEQEVKFNPEITEDNKDFLATLGQWNNKKKQFEVRTYDEQNKQFVNRNINELSNEEIEKLRQEPDDDIRKIVENTFSINQKFDQMILGINSQKAAYQDGMREQVVKSIEDTKDVLGKMDFLGGLLIQIGVAAIVAAQALNGVGGIFKGMKGARAAIKKGAALPKNAGMMETGMYNMMKSGGRGARMLKGGAGGAILGTAIAGYELWDASKTAEQRMIARSQAIKEGTLKAGSKEDKALLKDIQNQKKTSTGKAVGSLVGGIAGGALGSFFGPLGTMVGASIGSGVGSWAGGLIADDGDKNTVDDGISNKKTVIKANKDDTALFAKDNGPFDKLFGNIIPKIDNIDSEIKASNESYLYNNEIHNKTIDNSTRSSKIRNNENYDSNIISPIIDTTPFDKLFGNIIPKIDKNLKVSNEVYYNKKFDNENISIPKVGDVKNEIIEPKPIGDEVAKIKEVSLKESVKPKDVKIPDISVKPIEVNINGTLKLDMGSSGQVDIMKELKNNPGFMRELSRMLVEQMSSSLYGGKPKLDQNRFARFQS
uniref:Tail tape measure protein n=1 Tax=Myoviridae sp. ctPuP5 TaxID=2823543 RepID=A0A8S5L9A0_9CAUD|nr:MAG TPA: hypothetical protein [Myoviridae sp. ctPuP5]